MHRSRYPIAETWYRRLDMEHGVTRMWEPHVHPLEQANFWHIEGRDRDMLIDSGMGIVPLRDSFPDLFGKKEILAVATHTHIDHIGAITNSNIVGYIRPKRMRWNFRLRSSTRGMTRASTTRV
jgi:glyoxylase-like metal-dependent hydrolase (beta-lactamase superfamily II)